MLTQSRHLLRLETKKPFSHSWKNLCCSGQSQIPSFSECPVCVATQPHGQKSFPYKMRRSLEYALHSTAFMFGPIWILLAIYTLFSRMRAAGVPSRTQALVLLALLPALFPPLRNWPRLRSHPLWKLELRRWNVHVVDERMGTPMLRQAAGVATGAIRAVSRRLPSGRMFGGGASGTSAAMLVFEPHGIFPHGPAMGAVYRLGEYLQQFRALGASVVRFIPPVNWLAQTGAGMVPVSRSAIQRHWKAHPRHALGIVPGGIAEMFYSDTPLRTPQGLPLEETLVLKSRKGFVRLALEQGADIIPVYVFGASQTFRLWPKWPWLRELSRAVRMFLGVPVGEMGLPAPLKVPLLYAIGEAIQAGAFSSGVNNTVTDADVQAAHAMFVQRMRDLFQRYKAVYGWPQATSLRII